MRSAAGLLVTLIVVSLLGGQGSAAPVEPEIAYTDFKALVEQGKVEEIVLQGGEMAGKLRAPVPLGPRGEPAARFRTRIPGFGDADLLPALQRQAVRLRVLEPADGWARALGWGIPVVLLLWIFALVRAARNGAGGLGGGSELLRPGRFDRHVTLDLPDRKDREDILRVHVRKVPLAPDVDLARIATTTPGFSGADLKNLVNEAAILSAREALGSVTSLHFEEARDKVVLGAARNLAIQPDERHRLAVYEGGHTLVRDARWARRREAAPGQCQLRGPTTIPTRRPPWPRHGGPLGHVSGGGARRPPGHRGAPVPRPRDRAAAPLF